MPKYNVSVSFSLRTMIEPEGIRFDRDYPEGVEDIEDESYFRNCEIDADGGTVTFTVTAESEEDAERISEEIIYDSMEVEDDMGLTWQVDDIALVAEFIRQMEGMDEEYEEAFRFILDQIGTLPTLAERDAEIRRLQAEVTRLGGLLTAIQVAQAESEAPTV